MKRTVFIALISALALLIFAGCTKSGKGDDLSQSSFEMGGGDETNGEQTDLQAKYPEYFGLDASGGLDVIVWQMAPESYSFGLLEHSGATRDTFSAEFLSMKGAGTEEMKAILKTYGVDEKDVCVIAWQNPVSSYLPAYLRDIDGGDMAAAREAYAEGVRKMLFER